MPELRSGFAPAPDDARVDIATLLEQSRMEIFVIDATSGRFLYANERALANTGYTIDELAAMTPLDLQVGVTVHHIMQRVQQLRDGRAEFVQFHAEYRRKDGTTYGVEQRTEYVASHEPPVFIARVHEPGEVEHWPAETTGNGDDTFRKIVEEAAEGVWAIDAAFLTTFVNEWMARMLGYRREEMLGASLFAFMDDEGTAIAKAKLERRRHGEREHHDFKFVRRDGSELWTIVSAHPQYDGEGRYAGAVAHITDITERKQGERALLARLHLAAADGVVPADDDAAAAVALRMPSIAGLRAARVAKRFSVLADARRLELVELLASGDDRSVGALAEALRMSQSNVSKHLKVLAEAGLVSRRADGPRTIYSLSDPTVAVICGVVCHWLGNQVEAEYQALAG